MFYFLYEVSTDCLFTGLPGVSVTLLVVVCSGSTGKLWPTCQNPSNEYEYVIVSGTKNLHLFSVWSRLCFKELLISSPYHLSTDTISRLLRVLNNPIHITIFFMLFLLKRDYFKMKLYWFDSLTKLWHVNCDFKLFISLITHTYWILTNTSLVHNIRCNWTDEWTGLFILTNVINGLFNLMIINLLREQIKCIYFVWFSYVQIYKSVWLW